MLLFKCETSHARQFSTEILGMQVMKDIPQLRACFLSFNVSKSTDFRSRAAGQEYAGGAQGVHSVTTL